MYQGQQSEVAVDADLVVSAISSYGMMMLLIQTATDLCKVLVLIAKPSGFSQ